MHRIFRTVRICFQATEVTVRSSHASLDSKNAIMSREMGHPAALNCLSHLLWLQRRGGGEHLIFLLLQRSLFRLHTSPSPLIYQSHTSPPFHLIERSIHFLLPFRSHISLPSLNRSHVPPPHRSHPPLIEVMYLPLMEVTYLLLVHPIQICSLPPRRR